MEEGKIDLLNPEAEEDDDCLGNFGQGPNRLKIRLVEEGWPNDQEEGRKVETYVER